MPDLPRQSNNDDAYYARRGRLLDALNLRGGRAPSRYLTIDLGWDIHEVRAKLMSLRTDGLVSYDGEWWQITPRGKAALGDG